MSRTGREEAIRRTARYGPSRAERVLTVIGAVIMIAVCLLAALWLADCIVTYVLTTAHSYAPHVCTYDGGGTSATGSVTRTGRWFCAPDGTLLKVK
jgi:hypothetical protein